LHHKPSDPVQGGIERKENAYFLPHKPSFNIC